MSGRSIFFSISHNKVLRHECLWASLVDTDGIVSTVGIQISQLTQDFCLHKAPFSPKGFLLVIRRRLACAYRSSRSIVILLLSCSKSSSLMLFGPDSARWCLWLLCVASCGSDKGIVDAHRGSHPWEAWSCVLEYGDYLFLQLCIGPCHLGE